MPAIRSKTSHVFALATRRQQGSGMAEMLLVALPMLGIGLGTIEATHYFHVRQQLGLALTMAARAGAVAHANPTVIANAFEHALGPLYPPNNQAPSSQRINVANQRFEAQFQRPRWHIQLVSPDTAAFSTLANPQASRRYGRPAIRNTYLPEQQARLPYASANGVPGKISGQTIFQATTLTLTLHYGYAPWLPGLRQVFGQAFWIRRSISQTMQSDALWYPDDPQGRVNRQGFTGATPEASNNHDNAQSSGENGPSHGGDTPGSDAQGHSNGTADTGADAPEDTLPATDNGNTGEEANEQAESPDLEENCTP